MFVYHFWVYRGNSDFIVTPDTYLITPPFTQRLTRCLLTSSYDISASPWAEQWMKAPNLSTKFNHHISLFVFNFFYNCTTWTPNAIIPSTIMIYQPHHSPLIILMFVYHFWVYRENHDFIVIPNGRHRGRQLTSWLPRHVLTWSSNSNTSPWAAQWMKAPNLLTEFNHHISLFVFNFSPT